MPVPLLKNDLHMATMVLYMTDVQEVVVEEVPEYTLENYMSDVGGASGLILGRVPQTP